MASSSESESDIPLEEYEDESCNLEVSITVTEAEGEEIEDVFNDALSEIRGEKSCEFLPKEKPRPIGGIVFRISATVLCIVEMRGLQGCRTL